MRTVAGSFFARSGIAGCSYGRGRLIAASSPTRFPHVAVSLSLLLQRNGLRSISDELCCMIVSARVHRY